MSAALEFRNLTLGYDRHPAVHHLHGQIASGALMAVVGPNGAGKSTLFKGIVGMLKPLAGGIDLCGLRARDIAYLPQVADIDRTFPISVYDMVAMGLWKRSGAFRVQRMADREHRLFQAVSRAGRVDLGPEQGHRSIAADPLFRGRCSERQESECASARSEPVGHALRPNNRQPAKSGEGVHALPGTEVSAASQLTAM